MKKAQGLSVNTIVIIGLALIVFVILAFILAGNFGKFRQGTESCSKCVVAMGKCDASEQAIPMDCGSGKGDDKGELKTTTKDGNIEYCCQPIA